MPAAKGSKSIWIRGELYARLQEKLREERWKFGMRSFVDKALTAYCDDKTYADQSVSTEKLFMTMFAMGIIEKKRLDQLISLIRAGTLSAVVPSDRFGIDVQADPGKERKK